MTLSVVDIMNAPGRKRNEEKWSCGSWALGLVVFGRHWIVAVMFCWYLPSNQVESNELRFGIVYPFIKFDCCDGFFGISFSFA